MEVEGRGPGGDLVPDRKAITSCILTDVSASLAKDFAVQQC